MTKRLKIKFLVPILILQFLALAVLGYVGYRVASDILRGQATEQFQKAINSAYDGMDRELGRRMDAIEKLIQNPLFIKFSSAPHYKSDVDVEVFNFMKGSGLELGEPEVGGMVNYPVGLLANEGNRKILADGTFPSEEYVGTDGIVKQHVYLGGSNDLDFEARDEAKINRFNTEWFKTAMAGKIYVGVPKTTDLYVKEYQPISIESRNVTITKELVTIAVPHRIGDTIKGVLMVTTTPDFLFSSLPKDKLGYLLLVLDGAGNKITEVGNTKIAETLNMPTIAYLQASHGETISDYGSHLIMHKTSSLSGWTVLIVGSKDKIYAKVYELRNSTSFIIMISIAVMGLIVFLIINQLLKPIMSLKRASDRISSGELGVVIEKSSDDEIGSLTESFNNMSLTTKDMHDQLSRQNIRLSRINFIRRQILHIISHEMRTPLNGVIGFYDLLKDEVQSIGVADNEEFTEMFTSLGRSIDRCKEMVERLTKTTRVMSGQIKADDEALEFAFLAEAISESAEKAKMHSQKRNIDIIYSTSIDCKVACSPDAVKLLLEEALSNAVKHSPDGKSVHITLQVGTKTATIKVIDQGSGISKEYIEDVVEPFFEIQDPEHHFSDRYKQGAGGLGLGLTIIASILKRYQGELKIESEEGKGTTLLITLPLG